MTRLQPLIIIIAAVAALLAAPVAAQNDDLREGGGLLRDGARSLFRGLVQEMEPALDELRGLADQAEPKLRALQEDVEPRLRALQNGIEPMLLGLKDRIDDLANYQAPEVLENGDIILRRRPDAPDWPLEPRSPKPRIQPGPEVEL